MRRAAVIALFILMSCLAAAPARAELGRDFQAAMAARDHGDYATATGILARLIAHPGLSKAQRSELLVARGVLWQEQREYYRAISDFSRALALTPDRPEPHNNLAWIMATCWNADFRDAEAALKHAQRAVELSPGQPDPLDTLAAAQAEAGQWEAAKATQEKVVAMQAKAGAGPALEQAQQRLAYYKAHKPWRDWAYKH
ncbi:MAG: hypothetical protein V1797_09350 [Pseudomonadota bacterium]